jgi:hypothetical protein
MIQWDYKPEEVNMDWSAHTKVRTAVERYYQHAAAQDAIDIPKYDLFVTQVRKDWEQAGYDLNEPDDLFKLWGMLQVTLATCAFMMIECENQEQMMGVLKVVGNYGNMMGLFLREASKGVAPPLPDDA